MLVLKLKEWLADVEVENVPAAGGGVAAESGML